MTIRATPPETFLEHHDITLARVDVRVRRGFLTLSALPDPEGRFLKGMGAAWPKDIPKNWFEEVESYNSAERREAMARDWKKFRPTPKDVSDWDQALCFALPLGRAQWSLLRWRAMGWSYEEVGMKLKLHRQTVYRQTRDALMGSWHVAIAKTVERLGPDAVIDWNRAEAAAQAAFGQVPGVRAEDGIHGRVRGGSPAIPAADLVLQRA
jgi:hypothetical protein